MSHPIQNPSIQELVQARGAEFPSQSTKQVGRSGQPFDAILQDRLKVSAHAQARLKSREIELNQQEWKRVLQGVDQASQKGAKESLVLIDDVALIVSVKNRTVITAVGKENLKENVFTNIDSAVIV